MAGKKTFVAGEVLLAQDVNDFLMDQSVMNFTNEAARSSAIPTPTTGMVSYVGDTGSETPTSTIPQIQAYTGSAWQNVDGLTLLASVSYSAASSISIDNVFTSAFRSYLVVVNQTAQTGTGAGYQIRFRTNGTNNENLNYNYHTQRISSNDAVVTTLNARSQNIAVLGAGNFGSDQEMTFTVSNPNLTARTVGKVQYVDEVANNGNGAYAFTATTVFDGFTLIPATPSGAVTVTGTFRVYGYRDI
jgi:hypothetical protein